MKKLLKAIKASNNEFLLHDFDVAQRMSKLEKITPEESEDKKDDVLRELMVLSSAEKNIVTMRNATIEIMLEEIYKDSLTFLDDDKEVFTPLDIKGLTEDEALEWCAHFELNKRLKRNAEKRAIVTHELALKGINSFGSEELKIEFKEEVEKCNELAKAGNRKLKEVIARRKQSNEPTFEEVLAKQGTNKS